VDLAATEVRIDRQAPRDRRLFHGVFHFSIDAGEFRSI
jgi:hypothetical protein